MIKLFRRIRQQLLSENKTRKYLAYAIGEIILVVIGILIALQVNNWNEFRKDRKNEKVVLKTIYNELAQNLEYSTEIFSRIENRNSSTVTLMEYTANPDQSISANTFDSLMIVSFLFPPYTPVKANLERVLGSEQIDLIRSFELQEKLSDYNAAIDLAILAYRYAEDDFKLTILPYFVKHYPMRALMVQYGINVTPTIHQRNHRDLLTSMEFENILVTIYADSGGQFQEIIENLKLIKEIKSLIEKEYEINTND